MKKEYKLTKEVGERMDAKWREQFKKNYQKFIYAENYIQVIEYAMQTNANLFWMDVFGILDENNIQKIRTFILENLKTDQDWKKRLISLTI